MWKSPESVTDTNGLKSDFFSEFFSHYLSDVHLCGDGRNPGQLFLSSLRLKKSNQKVSYFLEEKKEEK